MSEKTLQFNNVILIRKIFISLKNQLTYCQQTCNKYLYLISLNIITKALSIVLVT